MSVTEIHEWLKLDVAVRQRKIRDFYATNSLNELHDFLGLVRAPRGYGVYASIGPNYQYAIFGRDSITVAHDLMLIQPALAKEIILLLARLQGHEFNMQNEEEQGKIHHEYRSQDFSGHGISKAARTVLEKMGPAWGGTDKELLYYGSYDATPLFICLVERYCRIHGDDILRNTVHTRGGLTRSLRQVLREAAAWLAGKITGSSWGMYEFKRLNPVGLVNQSWQDSSVSYLHADGTTANSDGGIAAIELQGYAYDALHAAAQLVAADDQEASAWRHLASMVRNNALERLWMPGEKYFCMGLDRADDGTARQITTLTANPALLLESNIFTRMPHHLGWQYVEGIVRTIFTHEFLTEAGLRLRARSHAHLVAFADYHGSLVTWPKHTFRIAQGLRRHGLYRLAFVLEDMALQTVGQAGEFYEFFLVDRHDRVKYHYRHDNPDEPTFHDFGAANLPEPGQAWTISSVISMVNARHNPEPILPVSQSVRDLEDDVLAHKLIQEIIAKRAPWLPVNKISTPH